MDSRIDLAAQIIKREAEVVASVANQLGASLPVVVDMMLGLEGRVVTAGMGKAGIIAEKASATFASTGTPSIFLHPAEAVHGDLGRVTRGDLLLVFSKSGETDEVLRLLGPVRAVGVSVVAITQSAKSTLGRHADLVLELGEIEEADRHDLAPTASTTAMLVLADAVALVVMDGRNFGPAEFARFHPGGNLGRRLMTVEELMRKGDHNPTVSIDATVLEAITVMTCTEGRPGATNVVDEAGMLIGIFTDGDLRRLVSSGCDNIRDIPILDVMTVAPKTVEPQTFAIEALGHLHKHAVDQMPVVDSNGLSVGLVDIQDLIDLEIG